MRARAEWLFCIAFILCVTGCGSSKPAGSDTDAGGSGTAAEGGKGSNDKAGSGASAGHSGGAKAGTGDTGDTDSGVAGEAGATATGGKGAAGKGAAGKSGTAGNPAVSLPDDGNQLAVCSMAQGDCNKGFACYAPGSAFSSGRGFCSKVCSMQSDCDGLTPSSAKYTCPMGAGTRVCELSCTGADDTSCPSDMTCQETMAATRGMGMGMGMGGEGGSGGTPAVFHCKYPFEKSPAWGVCGDGVHMCDKDLNCSGLMGKGYCTKSCEMDSDCSDKPSSGTITPTCVTINPARGNVKATKACVLSCAAAKDGCPTDQTCVDGPKDRDGKVSFSRCGF